MFDTRYRRLRAARVSERDDGRVELGSEHSQRAPLLLSAQHYQIAQLYDGTRSAAQIREALAAEFGVVPSPAALEAFAAELAIAGVLQAGFAEPLPSPSIVEPRLEGEALYDTGPLLPSTAPGSLTGPGMMEGLLDIVAHAKLRPRPIWLQLQPGFWTGFGSLLIWPLHSRAAALGFVALLTALIYGVHAHYLRAAASMLQLFSPVHLLLLIPLYWLLLQVFSIATRAAAIQRYADVEPAVSVQGTRFGIPLLVVDTSGPAERAPRAARMRIIASGLVSTSALSAAATLVWFLSHSTQPLLGTFAIGIAALAAATLLFRINPLVRRDGYFLLAQYSGIADLREQAGAAWFNAFRRGWVGQQRVLSPLMLRAYWALVLLYLLVMLYAMSLPARLLVRHYGGPGMVLLVVMGVIVSQTFRSTREGNNLGLGAVTRPPWYRRRAAWIAVALAVAAVPYRYDPSGDFVVLPGDRADVRALIAGDVREVRAKEGDLVTAGQVIARISDDEERAQVASAEARLAQLNSDLALATKGGKAEEVSVAESAVETARKRAQVSAAQAQRLDTAYKRNSVTAQEYERARGAADIDQRSLDEAVSKLKLVRSAAASDFLKSIQAQIGEAEATLSYARKQLDYTEIKAPIAGRVVSGTLQFALGTYLNRGDQLAVIEGTGERLAEVKMPEAGIDQIKIGKPAWAKVWAFPSGSFDGTVRSIAPNAEDGPYGKVIRVQVVLKDPDQQLLPGMTGNAKLAGHWYPAIMVFTRALSRFVFVEVWSWIP